MEAVTWVLLAVVLVVAFSPLANAQVVDRSDQQIMMTSNGYFIYEDGSPYVPLGGLYANVILTSGLDVPAQDKSKIYTFQGVEPCVDFAVASEELWRRWFEHLQKKGVTSLRLFCRAGGTEGDAMSDVLDLGGEVNMRLWNLFDRYMELGSSYGIKFLFLVQVEPMSTVYYDRTARQFAVRLLSEEVRKKGTSAQKEFWNLNGRYISFREYYTDPKVRECQRMYMYKLMDLIKNDPRIFAFEVYNEEGWDGHRAVAFFDIEDEMIEWTNDMIRIMKEKSSKPVCISHPGFGIGIYDPIKWSRETNIDFYSPHMYCGLCGEENYCDFPMVSELVYKYSAVAKPNFPGEWGVLGNQVNNRIKKKALRDAIWFTLLSGGAGFLQWPFGDCYGEEYRQALDVMSSVDLKNFKRQKPDIAVDISQASGLFAKKAESIGSTYGDIINFFKKGDHPEVTHYTNLLKTQELFMNGGYDFDYTDGKNEGYKFVFELSDPKKWDLKSVIRPLIAADGYQLRYLAGEGYGEVIVYLRNYTKYTGTGHRLRRTFRNKPVYVDLNLPGTKYRVEIRNLDESSLKTVECEGRGRVEISNSSSSDYILHLKVIN